MNRRRQIRFLVTSFTDAAISGACGSHSTPHRLACAWVLAVAPLVVPLELRATALDELLFLSAMTGAARPLARCEPRALKNREEYNETG